MVAPRNAGLVGCGRMGAFTSPAVRRDAPACWFPLAHAEAIAAHPGLHLAGLTDNDTEAAARAAAAHGNPPVFPDVGALLAATSPALLCVATRTLGRADIIEQALDAGVRALHVEKPLCNSMAELAALETRFAAGDHFLTLGAIRRFMAPYRAALAHVQSGAMGDLREIQIQFGETSLCWSHPHSIDLLLFAAGNRAIRDVSAVLGDIETGSHPHEIRNDPLVHSVTVRFHDGLIGRITRVPGADMMLACQTGALSVEADGHRLRALYTGPDAAYPAWQDWPLPPQANQAGTLAALTQLVDCLDGKADAIAANAVVKRDILLGQRLLFAILQSNEQHGTPVELHSLSNDWYIAGLTHGKFA